MKHLGLLLVCTYCWLPITGQQFCALWTQHSFPTGVACGTKSTDLVYFTAAGSAFAEEHSAGTALIGGSCIRSYKDCNCNEHEATEVTGGIWDREQFLWETENGWTSAWNIWWDIQNNHGHGFHGCANGDCATSGGEEPDPDFYGTYYNYNFRTVYCRVD